MADQADGLRRLMARNRGRQLAVVQGAPGTALSDTTRNLAAALTQQGQDVLLVDEHSAPAPASPRREGQFVLIDAVLDQDGALSPLAAGADHILVAFSATPAAIKQAYLCIKGLHYAHALQHMRLLVDGVKDAAQAQQILSNLALTGSRYLAVTLEHAGWVRSDPFVQQAQRLELSVVDAFAASPAAADFRQIAHAALQWPCAPTRGPLPSAAPSAGAQAQPLPGAQRSQASTT